MNIDMTQIRSAGQKEQAALEQARDAARAVLLRSLEGRAVSLTGPVSLAEQISWSAKESAARALLAGEASAEQEGFLGQEAEITGETVADLALLILRKAERYRQAVAGLSGLRRKYALRVQEAGDRDAVAAALSGLAADLAALPGPD